MGDSLETNFDLKKFFLTNSDSKVLKLKKNLRHRGFFQLFLFRGELKKPFGKYKCLNKLIFSSKKKVS